MSYCRDCNETYEQATILCPRCGATLVDGESATKSASGWESDGETDAARGWGSDDTDSTNTRSRDAGTDSWSGDHGADSWSGDDGADSRSGETGADSWSGGNETDSRSGETTSLWGSDDATTDETATAAAHHEAQDSREPVVTQSEPAPPSPTGPQYHQLNLFSFAVKFPIGKEGKPLLIGSMLSILGFLIFPLVFVYGYSIRLGRAAARGDSEPPSFDDLGGLAKDGAVLMRIGLGAVVAFALVASVLDAGGNAIGGSVLSQAYGTIVTISVLAGLYLLGAIVPVLIGTGSLAKTFGEFQFVRFALTGSYFKGVVITTMLAIGGYLAFLIAVFALAITIVGLVVVIPLVIVYPVYLVNVLFATWGHIYNQAGKAGAVDPVQPDDSLGIV